MYIGIPFPLLYGQQEPFGIEEYRNSFFIIGIYAAPIITIIAIPVNLLAAYLTKRMERYKNIVSFVVHIIPAFLVGLVGGLFFCKYYGFGSYDFLYCRLPNNA
ncbi:hypothetical protein [Bacillus sp. UNCCL13]|uniref:hypothetical protein n=1 Tax=Bacillus sp. UNCCL13 TaxID=1502772 RepID=UPI001C313D5D|nr:hypothetical protein [Bacillus sp. UNCCL13]